MKTNFEDRLQALRSEAIATGSAGGRGVDVAGGPIPRPPAAVQGYAGEPVVRPPVWTWEIPMYFFVGGLSGMAAVIAAAAWVCHESSLTRMALWIAATGAMVSPVLLIMDLGRPMRFLNMLRVFKIQSPMSVGAWILSAYGACTIPALVTIELWRAQIVTGGWQELLGILVTLLGVGAAFWGMLLATYTGVLLGVTVIPAWFLHRVTLPIHFGTVGLGSAVGLLELCGQHHRALSMLGIATAGVETGLWLLLEMSRHGPADRAVHSGGSGWMIRGADLLTGPAALLARLAGWAPFAAGVFLIGGLLSRFGWMSAGRASGRDPAAAFAAQGSSGGT